MAFAGNISYRLIYRGLKSLSRWQYRMEQRMTPMGRFLLGFAFAAAVLGIDARANLLYQAFSLILALLLISGLGSAIGQYRLNNRFYGHRELPNFATVGTPLNYSVEFQVIDQGSVRGYCLQEQLPDPRPSLDEFLRIDLSDDSGVNAFDKAMGYPRWRRLVQLGCWADKPDCQPINVAPQKGKWRKKMALKPLRRGYLRLPGLMLCRPGPLGLFRINILICGEQSLLVLPKIYPVSPVDLPGRRCYQSGGVALASSVGDSQEFIGLREYRSGDSLRNIHWASWARSGKPQTKEYQDEFFTRHALVLDTFASRPYDPCFEAAVSVAASLGESIQLGDGLLDLMFVGTEAYCFTMGRGLGRREQFLEILACAEPCIDQSFRLLQQQVSQRAGALSAVICVLLEFDEPRRAMARELQRAGLPMKLLLVAEENEAEDMLQGWSGQQPARINPERLAEDLAKL